MKESLASVGIDIAKATVEVAWYDGERYQTAQFNNNDAGFKELQHWLDDQALPRVHACMEATSRYGEALAFALWREGHAVSVVNPAQIKAYAASQLKRTKTDREDSKLIAHFCATQQPSLWTPPAPELQALQGMVRHLTALKEMRQQERNRLKAGEHPEAVQTALTEHLAFLEAQIKQLDQQIQAHIDQHPKLAHQRDLLVTIPAIGPLTAAKFLAEVPDVCRFERAAQLAAYAGLTPTHRQSGSSVWYRGGISKTGNARLRTLFFMPALQAHRWNPIVANLVERLQQKGKKPKVIIVAVMRKLLHLAYGVLKTGQPFDPNYLVNSQASP